MHMEKKSSIKLIIIEMQVKAAIRCHLSPIKSIFKNFNDIQCWEWEMFFLTSLFPGRGISHHDPPGNQSLLMYQEQ